MQASLRGLGCKTVDNFTTRSRRFEYPLHTVLRRRFPRLGPDTLDDLFAWRLREEAVAAVCGQSPPTARLSRYGRPQRWPWVTAWPAPSEQQTSVKIKLQTCARVHAGLTRDRRRAPERCGADDAGVVAQLGHDEAQVGRRLEHPR